MRSEMRGWAWTRVCVEAALAAVAFGLFLLTLIWRDWIEAAFKVDPDGGSGAVEWVVVAVLLAAAVTFSMIARADWRRQVVAAG
jgi:hypothetical protein